MAVTEIDDEHATSIGLVKGFEHPHGVGGAACIAVVAEVGHHHW
jgi:hypothetical protein